MSIFIALFGALLVVAISYVVYLMLGGFMYSLTGGDIGDKGEATTAAVITGLIGIFLIIIAVFVTVSPANQSTGKDISTMTGLDYERHVAALLPGMGYRNVHVTKGSGDFGADIIAIDRKTGQKTCFQCKLYSYPVGVKAVQEVTAAKSYYNCSKAVVITNSTFTDGARKLARANGVTLMEHVR